MALVAVLIGSVAQSAPHVFLSIPKFGFILWAMTGGQMPPHFDAKPLLQEHFRKYVQDGDIVLATQAKSGTLWLEQLIHLLKSGGNDDYNSLHDHVGMVEMLRYPEDYDVDKRIARENKKRELMPGAPMTWFSHKSPGLIPATAPKNDGLDVRAYPKVKFVLIMRDPEECLRSLHPFLNSHGQNFSDLWGGFPPVPISKEEMTNMFAGGEAPMFLGYAKDWWPFRHEPNVLLLNYRDLKERYRETVERLASFLGIDATDYMDEVLRKASKEYMAANSHRMAVTIGRPRQEFVLAMEHVSKGQVPMDEFWTPPMRAVWEATKARSIVSPEEKNMLAWMTNGGSLP